MRMFKTHLRHRAETPRLSAPCNTSSVSDTPESNFFFLFLSCKVLVRASRTCPRLNGHRNVALQNRIIILTINAVCSGSCKESTYIALFRHVFGQPAPHDTESQTADNRDGPLKDLVPQRIVRKHDALHDTENSDGYCIIDS